MTPERTAIIRDILSHAPWDWILLTMIASEVLHITILAIALVAVTIERRRFVKDWRQKITKYPGRQ